MRIRVGQAVGAGFAAIAAIGASAFGITTGADAHTSASSGVDVTQAVHTTLHIHVTGCDRCSIRLQHAVSGRHHVWSSAWRRIGPDHVAVFTPLTSRTHGMSFVVHAPWQGDTGSVPNVVTRYAGRRVGDTVTRKQARHATRAEGCWAGTTSSGLRLSFHIARVPAKTLDGHDTSVPLAYAIRTMNSWKPMVNTFKGTISNQDAFYCKKPSASK